ncbi:NfeD family protein [Williamsia sterculiae]|uniref:Membrane protein implicated in regulation of membrane protease activity n=1 Tax=Williamsia sterculiae TaxID=1344003 RepID=A0A1N7EL36_9NOCA|nr:NfeD family protein [Williamsia sterculiae]SIR88739.1 Membrane protein implicated in regulation of membrane protease activity [Williamsia sterculiae]
MSALIWVIAALVLVGAEALSGELVLLMLAGGAAVAAGVDFALDTPIWVDGLVFAGSSVLLLAAVRPIARAHMFTRPRTLMNSEALPGREAVVLETVDHSGGRVSISGDEWSARSLNTTDTFEAGRRVTVMEIDGATAVVWSA